MNIARSVKSAILQRENYENEAEDPLSNFLYALRAPETKRQYPRRLKVLLDYLGLQGDLQDQAKQFMAKVKSNPQWAQNSLMQFISFQKQRVEHRQISPGTIANYYKATKLFVEMNTDTPIINWKRVSRGLPRGRKAANDRSPTLEELRKLSEYPDRRIKPIIYTMASSGIRLGAWDYLQWKHGREITAKQRRNDYRRDLREMETKLVSYKEEFELLSQNNDTQEKGSYDSKSIFIVHGHDKVSKLELARMIDKFGLKSIILDEQADMGRTIIEKFEGAAKSPGYAFVLFTPDDIGGKNSGQLNLDDPGIQLKRLRDLKFNPKYRGRQNVILELGFFFGRLGRNRVCCLYKKGVELPSDISGVVYKEFVSSVCELEAAISKELNAVGYKINQS